MNGNCRLIIFITMVVMLVTAKINRYSICRFILLTVRWIGNRWRWKIGYFMFLGIISGRNASIARRLKYRAVILFGISARFGR